MKYRFYIGGNRLIERLDGESQFDFMKRIVYEKLVDRTLDCSYEELSEPLFGDGNCFNESEVRKRCYGILAMIRAMDESPNHIKKRILFIADIHYPFVLDKNILTKYRGIVDTLVFGGDLVDFNAISKFKKATAYDPVREIVEARQYLIDLIEFINPKEIYAIYGNHDIRFGNFLDKSLGNSLVNLMPTTPLDLVFTDGFYFYDREKHCKSYFESISTVFPEKNIVYEGSWFCRVGNVIFAHPMAYKSGILATSDKAYNYFLNKTRGEDLQAVCMAHTHRSGEYAKSDGRMIYESGCFCDVNANPYNEGKLVCEQTQGFIYICEDEAGDIVNGTTQRVVLN
jgi:hypothetical protein